MIEDLPGHWTITATLTPVFITDSSMVPGHLLMQQSLTLTKVSCRETHVTPELKFVPRRRPAVLPRAAADSACWFLALQCFSR